MCLFCTTYLGLLTAEKPPAEKSTEDTISRLQTRYLRELPIAKTGWPKHHVMQYVKLALVEKEDVTLRDESLNEITKMTLQGEVDKILKRKEQLMELRSIFHYDNKPCPRLILIMGAPGKCEIYIINVLSQYPKYSPYKCMHCGRVQLFTGLTSYCMHWNTILAYWADIL